MLRLGRILYTPVKHRIILSQNCFAYYKPIKNSYTILGIKENATEDQIKIAYLKLIKQYHPDLNKNEEAQQKFTQIQAAYESIETAQKRQKYNSQNGLKRKQSGTTSKSNLTDEQQEELAQFQKKFANRRSNKQKVAEQYHFSAKLFRQHHDKIEDPKKDYIRYSGQEGQQYYAHKDEKPQHPLRKIIMFVGSMAILFGSYAFVHSGK